jgi:hypothetical protein
VLDRRNYVLTIAPTVYPVISSSHDKPILSHATSMVGGQLLQTSDFWLLLIESSVVGQVSSKFSIDMTSPRSPSCCCPVADGPELPKRHTTLFEHHLSNAENALAGQFRCVKGFYNCSAVGLSFSAFCYRCDWKKMRKCASRPHESRVSLSATRSCQWSILSFCSLHACRYFSPTFGYESARRFRSELPSYLSAPTTIAASRVAIAKVLIYGNMCSMFDIHCTIRRLVFSLV